MAEVGGDTQAAVAGRAAHVSEAVTDEAVSAVHAQPLPTVNVPQVDAVSFLSDGRSCEGETHRFLASGFLGIWLFLVPSRGISWSWHVVQGAEIGLKAPKQ